MRVDVSNAPVLALMGPTASGKTDLAIALARALPVDLISVDSAMIYRGMDIGTAKPDTATLAAFPHALVDILDPAESYSVARFRDDARQCIQASLAAGRLPVLVGGTMMYFRALLDGISELPDTDPAIRERVREQGAREGWSAMHATLCRVDPEAGSRIHPNDPQRIGRALEVWYATGEPLSRLQARGRQGGLAATHQVRRVVLAPVDRPRLRERIALRFDRMLAEGFVEEVARLRARPDLSVDLPAMRAVGYRQVWGYLEGGYDRERMRELVINATRQFAKRQLTWLRTEPADDRLVSENLDPNAYIEVIRSWVGSLSGLTGGQGEVDLRHFS